MQALSFIDRVVEEPAAEVKTDREPDANQVLQGEPGMALRPEETHGRQAIREGPQTVLPFN
jgi:hypothetical protein